MHERAKESKKHPKASSLFYPNVKEGRGGEGATGMGICVSCKLFWVEEFSGKLMALGTLFFKKRGRIRFVAR